jgi:hypothetical protein
MAGLDPAIHENTELCNQVNDLLGKLEMARKWRWHRVDGRVKPGHDTDVPRIAELRRSVDPHLTL